MNVLRKIAAEEIKQAWKRQELRYKRNPDCKVRKFDFFPKLFNSKALDYSEMVGPIEKLDSRLKTVPPLIIGLIKSKGIDEVVKSIIDGSLPILDVACHSQVSNKRILMNFTQTTVSAPIVRRRLIKI